MTTECKPATIDVRGLMARGYRVETFQAADGIGIRWVASAALQSIEGHERRKVLGAFVLSCDSWDACERDWEAQ